MSTINSTSINDLPTDPTGGGGSNISLELSETNKSLYKRPSY